MKGYITFEGIDGSGKTTQLKLLYEYLLSKNLKVTSIKEPGTTKIGKKISEHLLSKENREITEFSEICLFLIDRHET